METKKCITCKQTKPATVQNFYKNAECKKGFFTECKECMKQKTRERSAEKKRGKNMFI